MAKFFSTRLRALFLVSFLCLLLLVSRSACDTDVAAQDEKQIRGQFHLEPDVTLEVKGTPEQSGFFGREGLHISAVAHFTDEQFAQYVQRLEDKNLWQPVPFYYSPSTAHEHTKQSLSWSSLPFPSGVPHEFEGSNGKYYCSVILYRNKERVEKTVPGRSYSKSGNELYETRTTGIHCTERLESDRGAIITTTGVLDYGNKKLYAAIKFCC